MFRGLAARRLASMSEIDAAPLNWSDLGVSELVPTGTVTLLLADVEGSTRLWETQPEEMTAAFAQPRPHAGATLVDAHHGVRPIEQGEGDSFVIAFGRASDAVACALELQRAPLGPIRLRIGLHTGEVQLRDEANYIGPTINRTARLRDLAHGGQTVLSSTTSDLVADRLPADAWLTDLGSHPVRDLPRPEQRDATLSSRDPQRVPAASNIQNRSLAQSSGPADQLRRAANRNGRGTAKPRRQPARHFDRSGGAGKTRLAIEVAAQLGTEFEDGVCYVELAPITDPGARAGRDGRAHWVCATSPADPRWTP